jgi:hypothetical protein
MQSFSTSTLLACVTSTLLLQPTNVYAHAASKRDSNCPSTVERDVIVVGGGSGGT